MTKSKEDMDKKVELSPERACEILKMFSGLVIWSHRKIVKNIFIEKINMKLYNGRFLKA